MTNEIIITASVVTSGEKNDGKQLETLIEKSTEAGINVKNRYWKFTMSTM